MRSEEEIKTKINEILNSKQRSDSFSYITAEEKKLFGFLLLKWVLNEEE